MENRRATAIIPECALVCRPLDCSAVCKYSPRILYSQWNSVTDEWSWHMGANAYAWRDVKWFVACDTYRLDHQQWMMTAYAAPTSTQYRPWQLTRKVSIIGQYMMVSAHYTTNRSDAITCVFPHDDYDVSPCLGLIGVFYRIGRTNHWVINARITAHKLQFSCKKQWTDIFWGFLSGGVKWHGCVRKSGDFAPCSYIAQTVYKIETKLL